NMNYRRKESVKAGIQFHDLPKRYSDMLHRGLFHKFQELADEERRQKILAFFKSLPEAAMYLAVIGLLAGFFWYFTQRTPEYDADRPTQWGERFFQKVIKDKHK
ncbi:MAG: hypothetical protein ABL958_19115, partial [Bdellovibrionia bacterium]